MKRLLIGTALMAIACGSEGIGMGSGSIIIHNEDSANVKILISDTPDCVIGLHSSVPGETQRFFDIGETSVVCVGENPPGVPVQDGKEYILQGGTLAEMRP